jgi:cytochrome o ubiquinol oxidase subunit 3
MNAVKTDGLAREGGSDEQSTTKSLGFWIYLMTDCILFASLFATYIVLRGATNGGPAGSDLFDMPFVLAETLILLTSSFACGLAMLAATARRKTQTLLWLILTALLGSAFLVLEITEFAKLAAEGHGWWASAFLSAFFTLVGTHGLHIAVGLLWIGIMMWQLQRHGFTPGVLRRLTLFSLFWHFLDIIWIFIFTIVYLMGVI